MSGGDKDSATLGTRLVGLLEVFDRSGATVTRLPVTGWPVTVGRALSADLVLDDGHVAAEHLRIDAPQADRIVVTVLNTINGVRHADCGRTSPAPVTLAEHRRDHRLGACNIGRYCFANVVAGNRYRQVRPIGHSIGWRPDGGTVGVGGHLGLGYQVVHGALPARSR